MTTKIQKWGNSLAVRLPKNILEQTSLREGSSINISSEDENIHIKPVQKPKQKLEDLLKKITPKNKHQEILFGQKVGREAW